MTDKAKEIGVADVDAEFSKRKRLSSLRAMQAGESMTHLPAEFAALYGSATPEQIADALNNRVWVIKREGDEITIACEERESIG